MGQTTQQTDIAASAPTPAKAEAAAAAKAAATETETETELAALEPGALYIMLFYMSRQANAFHWALYHHASPQGGSKFHVTRDGPGTPWTADCRRVTSLDEHGAEPLLGMVRVGNLDDGTNEEARATAHNAIQALDARVNDWPGGGLNCSVYVQSACGRLRDEGLLSFGDWRDVVGEVLAFGNALSGGFADRDGAGMVGRRPVVTSSIAR